MPEIIDFKQGSRVGLKLATHEKISCAVAVSRSKRLDHSWVGGLSFTTTLYELLTPCTFARKLKASVVWLAVESTSG